LAAAAVAVAEAEVEAALLEEYMAAAAAADQHPVARVVLQEALGEMVVQELLS
jgi:hypothetical protein